MRYFIANWKANKNLEEAEAWINILDNKLLFDTSIQSKLDSDQIKIVIAPPAPFISYFFQLIKSYQKKYTYYKNVCLAAQNISDLESGSYTGEITARSLQGLVDYAILGHSERRSIFNETTEAIEKKIRLAKKYKIEPVVCIRNKEDMTNEPVALIAYEPIEAIGTGENKPLTEILSVQKSLNLASNTVFLYGGSVNSLNIKDYPASNTLNGFLIGSASLDPLEFYKLIS